MFLGDIGQGDLGLEPYTTNMSVRGNIDTFDVGIQVNCEGIFVCVKIVICMLKDDEVPLMLVQIHKFVIY